MSTFERIRSGLPGLDSMLDSIRMGDNVVWQVSSMDDYMHFVTPLCNQLHEEGKELLYMHFSGHPALLQAGNGIRVYESFGRIRSFYNECPAPDQSRRT